MKTILFTPETKLEKYFSKTVSSAIIVHNSKELRKALLEHPSALLLYHNRDEEKAFSYVGLLLKEFPKLYILWLDDAPNYTKGTQYLKLGIKGYANAMMDPLNIQQAIDVISGGSIWLYPEFMQELIANMSAPKTKEESPLIKELSPAQLEVAKLVSEGKSNKEVAIAKSITERTVKAHLSAIYAKLEISDRLSLALLFKS